MSENRSFWGLGLVALALAASSAACVGGSGSVEQLPYVDARSGDREAPAGGQDPTGVSNEPEGSSLDRPGVVSGGSGAPGAGASGASSLQCSGTLSCVTTAGDKTSTSTVTLATQDGQCVATSDGDDVILSPDGSVLEKGKSAGTWKQTGTGFVFSSGSVLVTCTRK